VRVLFASTHGAGHFGPLVPFLDACVRGGHEVLVVGPPTLDARGYPFREGASPPDEELGPLWAGIHLQPPGQAEVIVVGHIFARLNVRAMLPALRAALEEWRPDLVVRETNEYASALAPRRPESRTRASGSASRSWRRERWRSRRRRSRPSGPAARLRSRARRT
jgi:hypothetical protein